jgi:general stress protein 26
MDTERLLPLARQLVAEVKFCVAATQDEDGSINARVVQPRPLGEDWSVDFLTNRRCRKVRDVERSGRITLLYQHDESHSYVSLSGAAEIVEDLELKRRTWTEAHNRWNLTGPEDPATVYARLRPDRIELWSASHGVMPEPTGYSAAALIRGAGSWRYSET